MKLKTLHLDNNNFYVSDVSVIAEAINKLTGLKELTVNNTGFTADHISTMITNNLVLEILDIGNNKLKSEGVRNLSKDLMKLSHLRVLGLYGNEITEYAASDIAEVICKLPVLEKLRLNDNPFGVVGMQTICKSLQYNGTLKLWQLDNVGITEEISDDIAAVIDSNPLLEYIYLGNNKLHSTGANVILKSLKSRKQFKALSLNNNCISEDVVDNVVQFVTSNPELEELLLNNNTIGTTGIINICRCLKDINTLRILDLADNNVSDEPTDAFTSVIESSTALEKISLDDKVLFNNNISTRLNNLKFLQINCKRVTEITVYKFINSIFANSNIEEITLKILTEEIHFLSPVNTTETLMVIKADLSMSASQMPMLYSVVTENKVEMVCTKDDVLVESEVMKLINVKCFQRLMLVFTRESYTDQELNFFVTIIGNFKSINSLVISRLSPNKYNGDISGIVIIEESEIIVMLTDGDLTANGITKLTQKVENITSLKIIYTGSMSNSFNEIVNLISNKTKLKYFLLRNDTIHVNAMENVFNCLTRTISIKTVKILNNLTIRNFDFTLQNDELTSQFIDQNHQIDKHHWHKLFCALKHTVNLKGLDLSGNAINKDLVQSLSILLDETSKIELLNLKNCSLGMSLKYINLQKIKIS